MSPGSRKKAPLADGSKRQAHGHNRCCKGAFWSREPRRFDLIAGSSCKTAHRTGAQVAQRQVPIAGLKSAEGKPAAIRGDGRITCLAGRDRL